MNYGAMSQQTFDENKPAIQQAVKLLGRNPQMRRRFCLCAVYENQKLVAELFRTAHGPVVSIKKGVDTGTRSIEPFTGDPDQMFMMKGFSQSYGVTGAHFLSGCYPANLLNFKPL